jgi:hypothetical protein
MIPAVVTGVLGIGNKLIDHFFPDADEAALRKAQLFQMQLDGETKQLEVSMSAIIAEANSEHKLVALARPMFMYLFYLVVIFLTLIFPIIGIFKPEAMSLFYTNVAQGFTAIPEAMWWTFTSGYLGYTGAREFGKHSKNKTNQDV